MNLKIFETVYSLMNYTSSNGSCQTHLPVQYASNIELIRKKWHWCCDWQRATSESHVQKSPLFAPLAVRVHAGCSAFPFYTPTKPLIWLHIKYKTDLFDKI